MDDGVMVPPVPFVTHRQREAANAEEKAPTGFEPVYEALQASA
jgi:hypothetical protein